MEATCRTLVRLTLTFALCAVVAAPLLAQAPAAQGPKGTVERIKVHGKSLEGNLEGDSPDRDVFIYLPPGYATNTNQRYPVAYMLHGELQPGIAAKWVANSPLVMVDQYLTSLKKYKAIALEVGTQDSLAGGNRQLDESLKSFSIAHTFETYEGDHTNRVPERIEQKVLPFFSNNLSFIAPRR